MRLLFPWLYLSHREVKSDWSSVITCILFLGHTFIPSLIFVSILNILILYSTSSNRHIRSPLFTVSGASCLRQFVLLCVLGDICEAGF